MLLCTAFALAATENSLALFRVRSRLLPCLWLLLAATPAFMRQESIIPAFCACIAILGLWLLFQCYQATEPVFLVFHSFLLWGIGSLFCPPLLCVGLFGLLWLHIFMHAFSPRTLFAAEGIWLAVCLWQEDVTPFTQHFLSFLPSSESDEYAVFTLPCIIFVAFVVLLHLVSLVCFFLHSFDDMIRVRMIYYTYASTSVLLLVGIIVQPRHFQSLLAVYLACVAPMVAHFFTHSEGKLTGVLFLATILSCISLVVLG